MTTMHLFAGEVAYERLAEPPDPSAPTRAMAALLENHHKSVAVRLLRAVGRIEVR